ncbi:hypothetical protein LGH82_07100 [Mesorhizobium sp. PAMC28654]|uniref:hypothetical protein n=1 Tax=Mesorhizobium sp. PAMC28654 TaxID=2880934 RepID=UPI001D0A7988|nr:hypothetical protein [Mesorhizobium sp. PAMC28654]UDL91038.1 hypothetical protein LGH82_07100 [Mesorhizobium sp. PAMC28654]
MNETINTLEELLGDPMIQLVMARDRVRPEEVRMLLERARRPSGGEPHVPPPHMIARTCQKLWLCS